MLTNLNRAGGSILMEAFSQEKCVISSLELLYRDFSLLSLKINLFCSMDFFPPTRNIILTQTSSLWNSRTKHLDLIADGYYWQQGIAAGQKLRGVFPTPPLFLLFFSQHRNCLQKNHEKREKGEFGAFSPARLFHSLQMGKQSVIPRFCSFLEARTRSDPWNLFHQHPFHSSHFRQKNKSPKLCYLKIL